MSEKKDKKDGSNRQWLRAAMIKQVREEQIEELQTTTR